MAAASLAVLGMGACGGSSGSSSTAAQTKAAGASHANGSGAGASTTSKSAPTQGGSTNSSTTKAGGASGAPPQFTAIRECLRRDGITLPANRPGGPLAALRQLPKGVSRARLQAAMSKCLGGRFLSGPGGRPVGVGVNRTGSSTFRAALSRFSECLRKNGVNVPAPNTSGGGPVFSTKGLDTTSPQFKAATAKCRGALVSAFKRKP